MSSNKFPEWFSIKKLLILFVSWRCRDPSAHTDVFKKSLCPDWLCSGLIHLNLYIASVCPPGLLTAGIVQTKRPLGPNTALLRLLKHPHSNKLLYSLNIKELNQIIYPIFTPTPCSLCSTKQYQKTSRESQNAALRTSHRLSMCQVVFT